MYVRNGIFYTIIKNLINEGYSIIGKNYGETSYEEIIRDIREITKLHELKKSGQEKGRIINPHLLSENVRKYTNYLTLIAAEYFDNKNIGIEMSLYQKACRKNR